MRCMLSTKLQQTMYFVGLQFHKQDIPRSELESIGVSERYLGRNFCDISGKIKVHVVMSVIVKYTTRKITLYDSIFRSSSKFIFIINFLTTSRFQSTVTFCQYLKNFSLTLECPRPFLYANF